MKELNREFERVRDADFELRFRYPTGEELKRIATLHRDMDPREQREQIVDQQRTKKLITALKAGEVLLEELEPELQELLAPLVSAEEG